MSAEDNNRHTKDQSALVIKVFSNSSGGLGVLQTTGVSHRNLNGKTVRL
jgi:hypothetical protein